MSFRPEHSLARAKLVGSCVAAASDGRVANSTVDHEHEDDSIETRCRRHSHPESDPTVKSIQENYLPGFAHCYGCGPANGHGHHLKSYLEDGQTAARFTPGLQYTGGFPDKVYGGLLASLLDCHGAATAAAFACKLRGHEIGPGLGGLRFVTASLKVDFKRPTPLHKELTVHGRLVSLEGRKAVVALTLSADGLVCVTGEMLAIELPASPDA